jgi:hypothetical protein
MDRPQAPPAGPVAGASPQSQSVSPGGETSSAPAARPLNSSKRAEQNWKAQRAFRERRDAYVSSSYKPRLSPPSTVIDLPLIVLLNRSSRRHIKYLESRSELLDAALQQAEESNRRWEEARGVMDALKRENEILRRALTQYNPANSAALSSLALPPHNPPARQLPSAAQQQQQQSNGQTAEDQHPILSVNPTDPSGHAPGPVAAAVRVGPAALSNVNGVRALQERARELREEGARIEKHQAGTRKRRRGPGAAANGVEGGDDAEEGGAQVLAATAAAANTNGKRKRPRAAQDAS